MVNTDKLNTRCIRRVCITFVYQSLRRYTVLAMDRSKLYCNPSTPIAYMFQYGVAIPFLIRILIRMLPTRTTLIEYLSLRIIPRILVAEMTMFSICECYCPVLLKVTPRCLWLSTKLIGILSKTSCGRKSSFLRVNKTASYFSGLNVTSHCLAHFVNSCKSWLHVIIPAMSAIGAAE